jgi:hypothetical protein
MALPIIGSVLTIGEKLIERLIPDPQQKADALLKLKELEQSGDLAVIAGQNDINKIEAASTNMFISGWRPAVGWVCALALLYAMVLSPIIAGVTLIFGKVIVLPVISTELLTTLLIGMLGLGGMRTVEKLNGAASK